jgi:hypothetical protein
VFRNLADGFGHNAHGLFTANFPKKQDVDENHPQIAVYADIEKVDPQLCEFPQTCRLRGEGLEAASQAKWSLNPEVSRHYLLPNERGIRRARVLVATRGLEMIILKNPVGNDQPLKFEITGKFVTTSGHIDGLKKSHGIEKVFPSLLTISEE